MYVQVIEQDDCIHAFIWQPLEVESKFRIADIHTDLDRDIWQIIQFQMQHFDVILSKVTESVEIALRAEIAEKLADVPNAPRNLIRQLAHDEISVAQPILERSLALSEDDLVRVIRQRADHVNQSI